MSSVVAQRLCIVFLRFAISVFKCLSWAPYFMHKKCNVKYHTWLDRWFIQMQSLTYKILTWTLNPNPGLAMAKRCTYMIPGYNAMRMEKKPTYYLWHGPSTMGFHSFRFSWANSRCDISHIHINLTHKNVHIITFDIITMIYAGVKGNNDDENVCIIGLGEGPTTKNRDYGCRCSHNKSVFSSTIFPRIFSFPELTIAFHTISYLILVHLYCVNLN